MAFHIARESLNYKSTNSLTHAHAHTLCHRCTCLCQDRNSQPLIDKNRRNSDVISFTNPAHKDTPLKKRTLVTNQGQEMEIWQSDSLPRQPSVAVCVCSALTILGPSVSSMGTRRTRRYNCDVTVTLERHDSTSYLSSRCLFCIALHCPAVTRVSVCVSVHVSVCLCVCARALITL